jgi:hypothetical protein
VRTASPLIAFLTTALSGCAGGIPSPVMSVHQTDVPRPYRPVCNPALQAERFMKSPKPALDELSRIAGAVTTPLKHISSLAGGPGSWADTGCNASGIGRPVRTAQHSTDDLYTIDIEILHAEVNGVTVPAGRFVRLEVVPGWPAHATVARRRPEPGDIIGFRGFLIWDNDKAPDHPDGHMEIHPVEPITFERREPLPN